MADCGRINRLLLYLYNCPMRLAVYVYKIDVISCSASIAITSGRPVDTPDVIVISQPAIG